MKTIIDFVNECKRKKGFSKDVELADYLGINKSCLSVIKKGGGVSQETAIRISRGSKCKLDDVWLANLAIREKNPIFKKVLENISKKSGIAASFLVSVSLIRPILEDIFKMANSGICILC